VAIHPPDTCYQASGYQVRLPRTYTVPVEAGASAPEFHVAQMSRTRPGDQTQLQVFWAWSPDGTWSVPDDPRLAFARHAVLFKLYLIREVSNTEEPLEDDPCIDLLRGLLPELQRVLFMKA
jgi:hypothetical protein